MNIEIIRTFNFLQLEEKLRGIPLMQQDRNGNDILPYKDAHISMRHFFIEDVNPPTFYLLKKNLELLQEFHLALLNLGYDFLHLNEQTAGLEILKKENNELWTLIPPVIESTSRVVKYVPQDGEINHGHIPTRITIQLICDGAHRVALARGYGGNFVGIAITGSNPDYSYYAHPNGWEMVKTVDEVPTTKEDKKYYRFEDCYSLYRNFDTIGCGKPRGFGTPEKKGE